MRFTRDVTVERTQAMGFAVVLHRGTFDSHENLDYANTALRKSATSIFDWLVGPIAISLTFGPVLDQTTNNPTGNTVKGSPVQLRTSEKVDLSTAVEDAKGAPIPDNPDTTTDDLSWSIDDENVATLEVSPDSRVCTVIAGMPGSAVLTLTLGELFATLAVDTIPGDAARLSIIEGTPVPQ